VVLGVVDPVQGQLVPELTGFFDVLRLQPASQGLQDKPEVRGREFEDPGGVEFELAHTL